MFVLLENRADVSFKQQVNACFITLTTIHINNTEYLYILKDTSVTQIVHSMLSENCVYFPQSTGRTALFFAAENGHDAAAAILLAHGADPHQKDLVCFSM